jgi:long-chain fatty acid transport protein
VSPINDRWSVGIGPNAGSGFGTTYGNNWVGRYLLDEWSSLFAGIVPSAAYRVNDKLSIGGSLSLNYSRFTLNKAVFNGLNQQDGEFELEADGWAFGFVIGVLYEFTDNTRIGMTYRSKLEASNEGTPDFSNLSQARINILNQAGIMNQEISVDTNQPQALLAGLFHDFENGWSMTIDTLLLDFSEWNIDNVTIGNTVITKDSTDYQDIWACSVGADYKWKPKWNLRGGLLYASSGLEDEDRTMFSRYDAMWGIGFGVKHSFSKQRSVAFDITYIQFGDGEVVIENAPLNNAVGDITGEYDEHYGIMFSIPITH